MTSTDEITGAENIPPQENLSPEEATKRALQERFEFLSGRWYELRDVSKAAASKDVEGEDGADVKGGGGGIAVEFRCLTCNSTQVTSTSSFSNLRRHVVRKHPNDLDEFDLIWSENSANLQGDDVVDFNETEEVAIAEIPRAGLVKMEPRDDGIERDDAGEDLTGGGVFSSYESKFEYLKTGGFYELMCVNESERASGIVAALQFRCLVCNTVQTASNQSLSNLRRHAHRTHPEMKEAFDMVWMSRRRPKGPKPKGSRPFFSRSGRGAKRGRGRPRKRPRRYEEEEDEDADYVPGAKIPGEEEDVYMDDFEAEGDNANDDYDEDDQDDYYGDDEEVMTGGPIVESLKARFEFMEEAGYFKLKNVKRRQGDEYFKVEFDCLCGCNKLLRVTTASYSNLRRHVARKHSEMWEEFKAAWESKRFKKLEGMGGRRSISHLNDTVEWTEDRFRALKERFQFLEDGNFFQFRAVKKREQGARGTPLEFRCLLCDAIQTASTATLSNLRRHVARVHEDDFQTYVDLWEIIKKSNRTSTLTVDAKHFEKSSFGFEDGYGKREPIQTMEEGDNDAADVGKMEEDGDDAFEFDNETLPDDSSLFGVLYHRYRFLKKHNLYELVAVKDKIGDDGKWHPLEFRCLECNRVQTSSTGSLSNLRRHMARMHMARINDYEEAWSKQRGARRSSKILYQASVDQIQERLSSFVPGGQATVNEVVKIPPDGQMAEQVVERLLDTYPEMVISVRKCSDSGGKYFLVSKATLPTEECLLPAFSAAILARSSGEFDIRLMAYNGRVLKKEFSKPTLLDSQILDMIGSGIAMCNGIQKAAGTGASFFLREQFGGRVFVRSENCKYIVDNNDMYNQCKECGSVLAADDGPLGGGGDDFEPDQKYHPATMRAMRATPFSAPIRSVKVEMDDQDWMPDAHGHIPPPKPRQPLNLPFALPRAKGGTVVRKAGRPSRAEAILRAKKEAEKNNGEFVMPEKPKYTRNPEDTCDESCSICLRHFTSRKQLGKHLAFHESRHDVKAPMNCPACGIECTKATLNTHYREHHHPGGDKGVCVECLQICETRLLKKHLYLKHLYVVKERLCPECGASFPSPLKLSVHMATVHDSSQTSVVCDQCGKWFPHPNKLMRHKYSHHNNKKLLECHACDKVFRVPMSYYKHIKVHSSVKPFFCTLCNYRAVRKDNVRQHVKKVHKMAMPDAMEFVGKDGDCDYGDVHPNPNAQQQQQQQQQQVEQQTTIVERTVSVQAVTAANVVTVGGGPITVQLPAQAVTTHRLPDRMETAAAVASVVPVVDTRTVRIGQGQAIRFHRFE